MRMLLAFCCCSRPCDRARPDRADAPTRSRVYAGLHEAAAKGDVAEIEKLIKEGERPNIQDSRSRTPLHVAVYLKQPRRRPRAAQARRQPQRARDRPLRHRHHRGGGERPRDAQARARRRRQRPQHHQPLRRHRADRRRASRPRRGGEDADRRQGAAQPRQQSRLDRADGIDRARQRRQEPHRHAARRWSRPAPTSTSPTARAPRRCSTRAAAATSRWRASWRTPVRASANAEQIVAKLNRRTANARRAVQKWDRAHARRATKPSADHVCENSYCAGVCTGGN